MKFQTYFLLVVFFLSITFLSCKKESKTVKRIHYNGSYNRDFNDLNDLHLIEAVKIGIKPINSEKEEKQEKKKMKEIKSNDYLEVMKLTHSIPFLIPEAADLLKKIGENFRDSLKNLNAPIYKLRVTSLTRTTDNISKLRKRNGNSSENSAHMYGTTFDISWNKYIKINEKDTTQLSPDDLKMVLASVLRDLKKQNKCYIKHERKQGCFHITARK